MQNTHTHTPTHTVSAFVHLQSEELESKTVPQLQSFSFWLKPSSLGLVAASAGASAALLFLLVTSAFTFFFASHLRPAPSRDPVSGCSSNTLEGVAPFLTFYADIQIWQP